MIISQIKSFVKIFFNNFNEKKTIFFNNLT